MTEEQVFAIGRVESIGDTIQGAFDDGLIDEPEGRAGARFSATLLRQFIGTIKELRKAFKSDIEQLKRITGRA